VSQSKPLKILVSAHAFSPLKGSECAVGWNYVRAIASRHKVWLITEGPEREEKAMKEATEEYFRQHPDIMRNVSFHYVPWKCRPLEFLVDPIRGYAIYRNWQRRAYRLARILDSQIDFDLVHQVNCIGFREPGYLWKLGKPFVWGPVGGLTFFPWRLLNAVPFRARLFFIVKNLSVAWSMYLARRPRLAASRARAIFAATTSVADRIHSVCGKEIAVSSEVSAPELENAAPAHRTSGEPLRIVWSGNCDPGKALNIVLLALGRVERSELDWRLIAAGDGPLLERWKALALRLGISERCSFLGRVPRSEVLSVMRSGHCFVQPSLYDATSTVLVEALTHGLPVICLDHMGFRDAVNDECAIRISPKKLDQVIGDFARAIESIGQDENRRFKMATAAQKASLLLTWKQKEEFINEVYSQIFPI
jgi:glycosyltransferase involved in cell wall biosynthesis